VWERNAPDDTFGFGVVFSDEAIGRPHLHDPAWTLHAAAEQDYAGPGVTWPQQYAAASRRPQTGRTDGPKPRLQLIREGAPRTRHTRWRPSRPG
jgi:anthraniloyl-CoA monooxygenase